MTEAIEIKYRQAQITPFWHKLPFFFLFPFRFGPLVFLAFIVLASAAAGLVLGAFGLVFRGLLAYLGLRYAFNVLELFRKGRFEGESPDHQLWGPEKRPAKLGAVIALFIVLAINLGNFAIDKRIARDPLVQERLLALYKKDHAEELAERQRAVDAFQRRAGLAAAPQPAPTAPQSGADEEDDEPQAAGAPGSSAASVEPPPVMPEAGPARNEILQQYRPAFGDPLWLRLQPAWFWLTLLACSLVLPAAAVVIALEDNLLRALNPLNVLHLVQAMGSAYFVLWAFFLAIAGARQAALTVGADWPTVVRLPVEMGLATYLGLVLFAIMGYALYQFHQELHLDVEVDFDEHREAGGAEGIAAAGSARTAIAAARQPQDPWEVKLRELEAAGNFQEAIAEVKDRMRYDKLDLPLNTRLHALYAKQGDRDTILAHGHQYLTALARAGKGKELVAVLQAMRKLDPAFLPQDGDVVLPAATAAMQAVDPALAASLVRGFDKRFPRHKDTPGVFFLGARLLSEQSRQHEKAAKILKAMLQHFPDATVAAEARVYLKVLEDSMLRQSPAA